MMISERVSVTLKEQVWFSLIIRHLTYPTPHLSDTSLIRHLTYPTPHLSDTSLIQHLTNLHMDYHQTPCYSVVHHIHGQASSGVAFIVVLEITTRKPVQKIYPLPTACLQIPTACLLYLQIPTACRPVPRIWKGGGGGGSNVWASGASPKFRNFVCQISQYILQISLSQ